jgi:hypothetical protein
MEAVLPPNHALQRTAASQSRSNRRAGDSR